MFCAITGVVFPYWVVVPYSKLMFTEGAEPNELRYPFKVTELLVRLETELVQITGGARRVVKVISWP